MILKLSFDLFDTCLRMSDTFKYTTRVGIDCDETCGQNVGLFGDYKNRDIWLDIEDTPKILSDLTLTLKDLSNDTYQARVEKKFFFLLGAYNGPTIPRDISFDLQTTLRSRERRVPLRKKFENYTRVLDAPSTLGAKILAKQCVLYTGIHGSHLKKY